MIEEKEEKEHLDQDHREEIDQNDQDKGPGLSVLIAEKEVKNVLDLIKGLDIKQEANFTNEKSKTTTSG